MRGQFLGVQPTGGPNVSARRSWSYAALFLGLLHGVPSTKKHIWPMGPDYIVLYQMKRFLG